MSCTFLLLVMGCFSLYRSGLVASINRNFRGLGRELFTDTGQYVIRFDSAGTELQLPPGSTANLQGQSLIMPDAVVRALTLDQRAMVSHTLNPKLDTSHVADREQTLATAVSSKPHRIGLDFLPDS